MREPRGGEEEEEEEELERLGILGERKNITAKPEKKLLPISGYDEWYGPIYTCPYCAEEMIMDNFRFCPACGGDMEGYGFETLKEGWGRIEKENERK